ncbi:hypothetical protein JCM11251_001887 [Rhodosporidiobolus azoricus]
MATTTPNPPKAPRSQFLQKLHSLLENPLDPDGLRWVNDDSFEISSKDAVAIRALSPQFEFHSLSSFIRQLSYYSFRRLSDRRRSTERRASHTGYIVFSHPTGFFVRGDPSKLNQIVRKARNRPEKGRRISMCSAASDDFGAAPPLPLPQWNPPDFRPQYGAERQPLPSLQHLPSFVSTLQPPPRFDPVTQWRNYSPSTSTWLDPNRADPEERFGAPAYRRASLGDFKLTGPAGQASFTPLPSLQEGRPQMRKAISSQELPTVSSLASTNGQGYHLPPPLPQEPSSSSFFRNSPYPTPTFDSTAPTYFSSHTATAPAPSSHDYYMHVPSHPSHSHLTYDPIPSSSNHGPFSSTYEPVAPASSVSPTKQLCASGMPLPSPSYGGSESSPTQSPTSGNLSLPALPAAPSTHLDPRALIGSAPGGHYEHHAREPSPTEYVPPAQPAPPAAYGEASPRSLYQPLPKMQQYILPPANATPAAQADYHHQQQEHQPLQFSQPWAPAPIRGAY